MSINDIKFLANIKQGGFKRPISWNKYISALATEPKNNLDYLTDPTFRNINRLFVISFKNCNNDSTRNPCDKNYMPLVKIKDFNALINNKPSF